MRPSLARGMAEVSVFIFVPIFRISGAILLRIWLMIRVKSRVCTPVTSVLISVTAKKLFSPPACQMIFTRPTNPACTPSSVPSPPPVWREKGIFPIPRFQPCPMSFLSTGLYCTPSSLITPAFLLYAVPERVQYVCTAHDAGGTMVTESSGRNSAHQMVSI